MKMPIFNDPERLLNLSNFFYIASGFFTLCMTFSIVYFGNRVSEIKEGQLKAYQKAADERIANANREAAQAKESASTADAKAEEARARAEQSKAIAEQSRLDKEKILHDNLLLQQQIESEKTARLKIEERIAPRHLFKEAQVQLIQDLSQLPRGQIDIATFGSNSEVDTIAGEVLYAFHHAGWTSAYNSPVGSSMSGILIRYAKSDASALETAQLVEKALSSSGISASLAAGTQGPPIGTSTGSGSFGKGKIQIYFGSK